MKKHSGQQIVAKLRTADVELGKGLTVPEVCKRIGVTEQTYYRWRQKYAGMSPAMIQEMEELVLSGTATGTLSWPSVTSWPLGHHHALLRCSYGEPLPSPGAPYHKDRG